MFKALFILHGGDSYSGYSHESYGGYSSNYSAPPSSYSSAYSSSQNYSGYSGYSQEYSYSGNASSGLYNSAKFIVDALIAVGEQAEVAFASIDTIEQVIGGSGATHVFIEGLWIPPEILKIIAASQSSRQWHVRVHSEIPFLASENIAMGWIAQYIRDGISVVANAGRVHQQIQWLASQLVDKDSAKKLTPLLPNCYPTEFLKISLQPNPHALNIGCFGAFRPLKNHLQQAFLALRYAQYVGKPLRYHINFKPGQENMADYINVAAIIAATGQELVLHHWSDRDTFLQVLGEMDLLLQVSMSETFNIVAADATLAGIPILVSDEITWAYPVHGNPHDIDDALKKLKLIMQSKTFFIQQNREGLKRHTKHALEEWLHYLDSK